MDEEFEQLRREFHASLKERANAVAALISRLPREDRIQVGCDDWIQFLFVVHKTAGVAATYDLPLLTDLTAALDDGMQTLMENGATHVPLEDFRSWCLLAEKALRMGSEGRDARGLPVPQF